MRGGVLTPRDRLRVEERLHVRKVSGSRRGSASSCPMGEGIENSSVEEVRSEAEREKRDAARKETCTIMARNASGALTTNAKKRIE
jgi:hypothetical protein